MAASSSSTGEAAAASAATAVAFGGQPQSFFGGGGGAKLRLRHHNYSRKDKSLGVLCSNFVSLYDRDDVESIGLDDASRRLGVERRRIYDIVNVLESVGILVRKAKNQYSWIGFCGVPVALRELKERALREESGLALPVEEPSAANNVVPEKTFPIPFPVLKMSDDEDDDRLGDPECDTESEKLSQPVDNPSDKTSAPRSRLRSDHRKEKSLGLLTQNFVKLFLTMEVNTISLDEAAKLLLGKGHEANNMRTKVRRLYDIANVLSSLNLIEKTQQVNTKKPALRWLGAVGKPNAENGVTVAISTPRKTVSNKRSFGTELTNFDISKIRLDSTTQKKAKLAESGGDILQNYKPAVQRQLKQVNKSDFVYGPFHPSGARKHEPGDCTDAGQRENSQDWESLADSFRPQYRNQALGDLFAHYTDAWKSWYSEFAQGSSIMQQYLGKSVINQFS